MWLNRISGGDVDIVSLTAARDHVRQLDDEDDAAILRAIRAATAYLDVDEDGFGGLGFPLVAQQWAQLGSAFHSDMLRLPFSRVISVDEVRYIGPDGAGVMAGEGYMLAGAGRSRRVALMSGYSWPDLADRPDAAEIRFTAGYASAEAVPDDIKQAALLLVNHFYDNRNAVVTGAPSQEIKLGVERLTKRYRRFAC